MSEETLGRPAGGPREQHRDSVDALTDEVLPALIARLRASRLGELEVRTGGWRVRLRRDAAAHTRPASGTASGADDPDPGLVGCVARSPAVGYFSPLPELVVGHSVQAGDLLGTIDVLGVVQEVTAPEGGIVSSVLAEEGQAVEYGQALAEVDALDGEPDIATLTVMPDDGPAR